MNSAKRSLGLRFIEIAQPYFYPDIRGGRWATLLLTVMLLVFLFGVLAVIVAALALAVDHFAPTVSEEIASGLLAMIVEAIRSGAWAVVLAMLVVPALAFATFRRRLQGRRQAWSLLAVVLLLSLSVTGINVAFSYIGNYFTNALVKKNQDLAYLFVSVYFGGFLVGHSHRSLLQLRAKLSGHALAGVDDRRVSGQLFPGPQLLRDRSPGTD